ncbi:MAG TPA: peptidoglycan editing factor PgeF [Tetrasphaera sp.]|uniref:peptidoglycan editing factor PgeF n=1 Tax=Nostocoides sp. TaxID=1917966 RepID=UPI002D146A1C|nr:peptidoglycan editing factor PgeF [Tetrasphaera sp.]HNQ08254.1 peptidoglycan editing factor PgeF [Tetrasphaera sp.]
MFGWQSTRDGITRALTDRHGGYSTGDFDALNLGSRVGDDPAAVVVNRATLAAAVGVEPDRLIFLHQVHGAEVVTVTAPLEAEPQADAIVTAEPDLALAVLAADCVPVLLADAQAGLIGAAHVGRPGLTAGTVAAVVERLRALGAERLDAVVGPAVCGACYEVPADLAAEVTAYVPQAAAVSRDGTPALDIAAGVLAQLAALGIPALRAGGCTRESADQYSYRRDGRTGRHAGVIVRRTV